MMGLQWFGKCGQGHFEGRDDEKWERHEMRGLKVGA